MEPTIAQAPVWNETTRTWTAQWAGVTVRITEDDADCVTVELSADPVSTPPLKVVMAGDELHNAHPDEDEWQARADEKRPARAERQRKRELIRNMSKRVGPNADPAEVFAAAADAAIEATRGSAVTESPPRTV